MKAFSLLIGIALICAASVTIYVYAQPPRDGHRPGPPRDPFFQLFDTDESGEISMEEMENAAGILKDRDRDQNGVLTPAELPRPPRRGEHVQHDDRHDPRPAQCDEREDSSQSVAAVQHVPSGNVIFSGGYQTDPRDHGRPVALIAAALGVKPQVFRDAFSGVTPSRFGPPSESHARANKKVLMDALGKHGVTNERLDEVSNYYRYRPGSGRLWTHTPASARAIIKDGKVTGFTIIDAGSGYMTAPTVKVSGYGDVIVKAEIEFGQQLSTNGRLSKLIVVSED